MDAAALLKLAILLIDEGPATISLVKQTYDLFAGGKITADELGKMWTKAGSDVQAARAKWLAAAN